MEENSSMKEKTVYIKVKRQASPEDKPYWESFSVKYSYHDSILTVISKLEHPNKNFNPVHHECNCKEEVCGTCTIRINGKPRLACSTLVKDLPPSSEKKPIILEPLEKFKVIKDLTVDRSRISRSLTKVNNWVETDDIFGSKVDYEQKVQHEIYSYSKCINCGSCYDACPRTSKVESRYIGPSAIAHVIAMNDHPLGKENSKERLETVMGRDGVSMCGKAMVCETVCTKKVPLVRSVTRANRQALKNFFVR